MDADSQLGLHLTIARSTFVCLLGAILLEQKEPWPVQRSRYMTLEPVAR